MTDTALNSVTDVDGLFSFGTQIVNFSGMWKTIWTWDLIAFGVAHVVAGVVALIRFRRDSGKWAWLAPVIFTLVGGIIPATAGLITALIIAGVYTTAGLSMTTTEALAWGAGQFALYTISSFSQNYETL